jgi:tyrosine-protein kinase Etk/Wzc
MDTVNQNVEEKGEDLFHYLLFRFMPYWPLFVLLLFVGAIGGWFYLKTATPMYRASATIMLKDEKKGVDNADVLEALNIYSTKKIVENEIEVIRSRTLMRKVVERLHLYAPVYMKNGLRDDLLYGYSPIRIEAKEPAKLSWNTKIAVDLNVDKGFVVVDSVRYKINDWVKTPFGELKFIVDSSESAYKPQGQIYFNLYNSVPVASQFITNLNISPANKTSTVLYLELVDESVDRAKNILDELALDYARSTIEEKNALAANTLTFIEDRLNYLVKEIDSIERTIQNYKSQQGIVDLSESGRLFLNNVGSNDRQLGNINTQLAVLDQVERYVLSKNKKAGLVPSTLGLSDEVLSRLIQKLYDAELQYERVKQTMGENSPAVVSITNEIENIRPAILESVRNQKESLQASREGIAATNGKYSSMLKTIPLKERKLVEISREQAIKNNVYTYLLQKREETALSSSTAVADSRLVDSAVGSWTPVSPKSSYVYFAAFFLAIIMGVAIVISKEFLPGKILFRSDIERFTRLPIVGELASLKKKSEIVINTQDKAFVSEQFRQLRAGMGLYGRKIPKQSILVTSTIAGEGKSFVASNLAVSLSLSGKKVILVDADFRSPKTTAIFNMNDEMGFVEYLKEEASLWDVIFETSYPNLWILPAGAATHNPTELLLNGKLSELFDGLWNKYDFIIVDTSPVAPVTDAYVLSDYCDKTLYVIRHGYTPKAMVKVMDENARLKALKNINLVFNGVKKRGFSNRGYGFGYGYGYEYVYKERRVDKR